MRLAISSTSMTAAIDQPWLPLMARQSADTTAGVIDPPADDAGDDGGDGDGDRWVTVATFWSSVEAHLARNVLEGEDIPVVIYDENVVSTHWLAASALGGIKLLVPLPDAHHAGELLGLADASRGAVSCPGCRSVRVRSLAPLTGTGWVAKLANKVLGDLRRCLDCGNTWRR
jgi:hypothetical protein